jgi:FkbM family methyltransferase
MSMKPSLKKKFKKFLTNSLPPQFLFTLKKLHYVRAVRSYQESDFEPLKDLVQPGDYVLDIGANVGWYTNFLSRLVGKSGRVLSFEPIPETFALLTTVIQKLDLTNVEAFNLALSDVDSSATMELPLRDDGSTNFYMARIVAKQGGSHFLAQCTVSLKPIDSIFPGLPCSIAFIKCDVEGHELSVIKGAMKLLEKCKPAWLLEVSGNPDKENSTAKALFEILENLQYTAYWFDGRKLKKRSSSHHSTNYFFLQASHLNRLSDLL